MLKMNNLYDNFTQPDELEFIGPRKALVRLIIKEDQRKRAAGQRHLVAKATKRDGIPLEVGDYFVDVSDHRGPYDVCNIVIFVVDHEDTRYIGHVSVCKVQRQDSDIPINGIHNSLVWASITSRWQEATPAMMRVDYNKKTAVSLAGWVARYEGFGVLGEIVGRCIEAHSAEDWYNGETDTWHTGEAE